MHSVTVKGTGRVVLPAYGLADAEHQVEKELGEAWPGCRAEVLDVARTDDRARIVEEFAIRYRVRGTLTLAAATDAEARTAALRSLRERFAGTRFGNVAWDVVTQSHGG
jgi:lipopolysaccharide biosynthesis protein